MRLGEQWVQWDRVGNPGKSKWHIDSGSLHNTKGRTGCGKRYPLRRGTYRFDAPNTETGMDDVCKSCYAAWVSKPEEDN